MGRRETGFILNPQADYLTTRGNSIFVSLSDETPDFFFFFFIFPSREEEFLRSKLSVGVPDQVTCWNMWNWETLCVRSLNIHARYTSFLSGNHYLLLGHAGLKKHQWSYWLSAGFGCVYFLKFKHSKWKYIYSLPVWRYLNPIISSSAGMPLFTPLLRCASNLISQPC